MHAITTAWLEEQEACPEQVALFRATFGESAEATPGNLTHAAAVGLRLDWLATKVLTAPARAEYDRATAAAWDEYARAIAPAWDEYARAIAPAWDEYARVIAAAWDEYARVIAAALTALLSDPSNWKDV